MFIMFTVFLHVSLLILITLPSYSIVYIYTVSQKNPCDYVFDDNLNSKRPIVIIFGTVIT